MISAVLCRPGEDARVVEIGEGLRPLQAAVGGPIGEVRLSGGSGGGIVAYVHDEGLLVGLAWNRQIGPQTYVAGPMIVTGFDSRGEERSLDGGEQLDVLRLLNVIARRLETTPATIEQLEAWLGEKAVRFYSGDLGSMTEQCGTCSTPLAPERKGWCPACHPDKAGGGGVVVPVSERMGRPE